MNKRLFQTAIVVGLALLLYSPHSLSAQELKPIPLLTPQMDGGRPLMQVLKDRKTSRSFSSEKLPLPVLSNMLWAGFGINRPDSGRRTAPSALNWQEIDLYIVTMDGLYLYEPKEHLLKPIRLGDVRALTGRQPFVKEAPVNLIYVADFSKMGHTASDAEKEIYAAADTGFIAQNIYLFCASEGLATGVRALIDRPTLAKAINLRSDQKIILAQSVGYPKK